VNSTSATKRLLVSNIIAPSADDGFHQCENSERSPLPSGDWPVTRLPDANAGVEFRKRRACGQLTATTKS